MDLVSVSYRVCIKFHGITNSTGEADIPAANVRLGWDVQSNYQTDCRNYVRLRLHQI